jgi:L-ribulose-5-phosphate 3-epimerase
LRYAYNSNGLKLHSAAEAVQLLADLGYDGIELALQHQHLHPLYASAHQVRELRNLLRERGLGIVCGAGVPDALGAERFEPSLFHPDPAGRAMRLRYLEASLQIAAELGSECLVLCTGTLHPQVASEWAWEWLVEGIAAACRRAGELGLRVALEPEPGHFVETLADYRRLRAEVDSEHFGITADIGHLYCTEEGAPQELLGQLLREERLLHVQIEDMRNRKHEHLPFGEGVIDFRPVMRTLVDAGYAGFVGVELSRHSERAGELAESSLAFLRKTESVSLSS